MKGKTHSNAGRITRLDQAWAAAYREYYTRSRIADIDVAHEAALKDERFFSDSGTAIARVDEPLRPSSGHQSLAVPAKYLSTALLTAAKGDIRYYLCGVYLHAVDGELRICGTDGHRLIVSRFIPKVLPTWAEDGVIIPGPELAQLLPLIVKNGAHQDGEDAMVLVDYAKGAEAMLLRSENGFANFRVKPVDGKFPDYAKVLAAQGMSFIRDDGVMNAAAVNPKYLKDAAIIGQRLGAIGVHAFTPSVESGAAAIFTFSGASDTVLIVMPMRSDAPVSEGVVKIFGSNGIAGSVAALRAHVTRTVKLLGSANAKDREDLEAKKSSLEDRIAALLRSAGEGPKRIEHRAAA